MTGSRCLLKPATVLNMHGLMEPVCVGVLHEVKKKKSVNLWAYLGLLRMHSGEVLHY